MSYETIWEEEGVYQCFSGQVSPDEKIHASSEVHGDPRFDTINYWITDNIGVDSYVLEKSDAEKLAYLNNAASRSNPDIVTPFISTHITHRDNIIHYLIHLKKIGSPWKGKLFEDVQTARQWISTLQST